MCWSITCAIESEAGSWTYLSSYKDVSTFGTFTCARAQSKKYGWTKLRYAEPQALLARLFSSRRRLKRLTTFLDTLWVMAPEVPSQQCVPPESCRLSRSKKIPALSYPFLLQEHLRRCISRSPSRRQNSKIERWLSILILAERNSFSIWAEVCGSWKIIAFAQVNVSFWRHDYMVIIKAAEMLKKSPLIK